MGRRAEAEEHDGIVRFPASGASCGTGSNTLAEDAFAAPLTTG